MQEQLTITATLEPGYTSIQYAPSTGGAIVLEPYAYGRKGDWFVLDAKGCPKPITRAQGVKAIRTLVSLAKLHGAPIVVEVY